MLQVHVALFLNADFHSLQTRSNKMINTLYNQYSLFSDLDKNSVYDES